MALNRAELHVAHVIACARSVAYGDEGEQLVSMQPLYDAVEELDAFCLRTIANGGVEIPADAPAPEGFCEHPQTAHRTIDMVVLWCSQCGAIQESNATRWVCPKSMTKG